MEPGTLTDRSGAETLVFEPIAGADGPGIEIVDPIERHRYRLETPAPVTPEPADERGFRFPVDGAIAVRTDGLALPNVPLVHVRDRAGRELAAVEQFEHETFPEGTYVLELHAPIKLFVRVTGSLTVRSDLNRTTFDFGETVRVAIGARSYHEHPAATVTTTEEPEDVMVAISTLGSALKTTTPERSFPTLRGHPPTIEVGEELDVPAGAEPPETGITVEIPPEFRFIYPAASLSYYLGARLVPGEEPRLCTDDGFEYPLARPGFGPGTDFERTVERTLKQTFFLDCLTRTEGLYRVDLHERHALEDDLDLDFAALYDASPAERLVAYLDVPFSAIEDQLPDWKLTTHVEATPASVEALPFVVDDLAVIRIPNADDLTPVSSMEATAFDEIGPATAGGDNDPEPVLTRSGAAGSANTQTDSGTEVQGGSGPEAPYVRPTKADSQEQAWIGQGTPIGANKVTVDAYRNRLARSPNAGDIGISVVCNDEGMNNEQDVLEGVYGSRRDLPFDVTIRQDLTTDELKDALEADDDFLHYIGHIDDEGFACADGQLDATALETVNVDAFLLNACHSYEQGMGLIEAGAIAGIVTLNDLLNHGAVEMGKTLTHLLNRGFSLGSSIEIARSESIVGKQYHVVGDGGLSLAQTESTIPNLCEIERDGDMFRVDYHTYPTAELGMGGMITPYLTADDERFLSSGPARTFDVPRQELQRFLSIEDVPVRVNGELHWSTELDLSEV